MEEVQEPRMLRKFQAHSLAGLRARWPPQCAPVRAFRSREGQHFIATERKNLLDPYTSGDPAQYQFPPMSRRVTNNSTFWTGSDL